MTKLHVVVASRGSHEDRRDWIAYIGHTDAEARAVATQLLRQAQNHDRRLLDEWMKRRNAAADANGGEVEWYKSGARTAFLKDNPPPAELSDIPEFAAVVAVPLGTLGKWDHANSWLEDEPEETQ